MTGAKGARAPGDLPVQRRAGIVVDVAAHGHLRADEGRCLDPRNGSGRRRSGSRANPDTLLDKTDLVFIDAVTTGLSRPIGKAKPKDFFGVDKDIDAFARGIQRYLTVYGRWNSPKFIIGESYGTTRAAGLSTELRRPRRPAQRHRVGLDGAQLRRLLGATAR